MSWSTGRIGVVEPDHWIADSATNLIESCAVGQAFYADDTWSEAVPAGSRGPGWGLTGVASDAFRDAVAEVAEASSDSSHGRVGDRV